MRRARIPVKPNIRPGGRSVTAGEQPSQAPTDAAVTAEKTLRPSPSPQRSPPVEGPAEAAGVESNPTSPSEKTSTDLKMRRARIPVKPNIRPGGRSVTTGEQPSQAPTDAAVTAEKTLRPSPSPQRSPPVEGPAEAAGVESTPTSPLEKTSTDLSDGTPSSGTTTTTAAATPAAVPQRRVRITVAPKLPGPKATSTPRLLSRFPRSVPSTLPREAPQQVPNAETETPASGGSTTPTEGARQSSTTPTPPSPCLPSASGLPKPSAQEKKSMEDSPPSPQHGQVPQQPPRELEPHKYPTSASDMPSAYVNLSRCDVPGSPQKGAAMLSDKEKILRALKLKELMKIERRKDIKKGSRGTRRKQEYTPVDRSKMTMKDLIYYLPDTSPMRNSTVCEETEEETIVPPSPKMPEKSPGWEEDEDGEEECEEEEALMPKVRVAEDGSIVLDEESLTVRIQRTSTTKVVENPTALFERGSTTTYRSFKNWNHVKSWSVRETDMFFLAISMVGTDFSLIGQLLTHRSRSEIKNKFKKEEKANGWRIDKAFRNKRPFDREFFSFLLEKVLAKDKEKGKSVKLVMATPKKRRKARGKKAEDDEESVCVSVDDEHFDEDFDMEDGEHVEAEKENNGLPNVNEADGSGPAKRKRKRTRADGEGVDKEDCSEEQGKKKTKSKRAKKTKNVINSSEDDAEGRNADGAFVNADQENEADSSTSARKKKPTRSKKAEEERQHETSVKDTKAKRSRKSLKVSDNLEESSIVDEEDSVATTKKRRRSEKCDPTEDTPASEKSSTKRKRSQKGTVLNEGSAEDGQATVTAEDEEVSEATKMDTSIPAEVMDKAPKRSGRQPKKPRPSLATSICKKPSEPEMTPPAEEEVQESQHEKNSIVEGEVRPLDAGKLQKHAVVVLEKTPPRIINQLSPSVRHKSNEESEDPAASPAVCEGSSGQEVRMRRAEKVKRSLTAVKKKGKRKAGMDQDEAEHDPGASAEDLRSSTDLLEEMVTQGSEEAEAENSLDENMIDFSCLHHLHSQMFQRKPMVVLSREEVSMILNVQDQTAEEDPSVSPLDLSLNTELSFQLQCSNLMDENNEAAQVESVLEEHGDTLQEMASCSVALEEKQGEGMGLSEPLSGWPGISTPTNIPCVKSEVCSQLEASSIATSFLDFPEPQVNPKMGEDVPASAKDPEGPPLVTSTETVASKDPACAKLDESLPTEALIAAFPEAVTQGATLASQAAMEESKTSFLETPEIKPGSQGSVLTTSEVLMKFQGSTLGTPEIKEGSQGSVWATMEIKEDLQASSLTPSETLRTSQGSIETTSEKKEISEGKKGCQEEMEQATIPSTRLSSGASTSSEVVATLKRSRFLKPKPNLSVASKIRHSSPKQKTKTEPQKMSSEKLLPQNTDLDWDLKDLSKERPSKEQWQSQPCLMDMESGMEKGPLPSVPTLRSDVPTRCSGNQAVDVPVLCDASPAVLEPKPVATVSLSADSAEEASEQTGSSCDVDTRPPCAAKAEDLHMADTSCSWPLPTQSAEQETTGRMTGNSEEICTPAEVIQPSGDGNREEEPTFILTLYEIPVTEAYPASVSNDPVVISPLLFSDQPPLQPASEAFSASQSLETAHVSHKELSVVVLPPDEANRGSSVFEKTVPESGKELDLPTLAQETPQQTIMPQAKNAAGEVSAKLDGEDILDVPNAELKSESKEGQELVPVEDLKPRHQSTPFPVRVSKCIAPIPQDATQCEGTSHMRLADVFVPVLELGDDFTKDTTPYEELAKQEYSPARSLFMTKENQNRPSLAEEEDVPASSRDCKLEPPLVKIASVKEESSKADQPNSSQIVLPESLQSTAAQAKQESNTVSEKALEKEHQITLSPGRLARCVGSVSQDSCLVPASEVVQDDVKMERAASEDKIAVIPSHKQVLGSWQSIRPFGRASHSTTITGDDKTTTPLKRRAKLQVKPSLVERKSVKNECPELPQFDLAATQVDPAHTIFSTTQQAELETEAKISARVATEEATIKPDLESSSDTKESSLATSHEVANLQPSHENMSLSGMMTTASCSGCLDSEEVGEDCEGVSHMVLADVFVPVSEEMGNDLSQDLIIPVDDSGHEKEFGIPKKPGHSKKFGKEEQNEQVKQTHAKTDSSKPSKIQKVDVLKVQDAPETEASPEAKDSGSDTETIEERLQRQHQIMPCAVKISRCTDSQPVVLEEIKEETEGVSQVVLADAIVSVSEEGGEDASIDWMQLKQTAPSSPPSTPSREKSVQRKTQPKEKKSPAKKKGKLLVKFPYFKPMVKKDKSSKSDSSESEEGALKLPQAASRMRQLSITDWAKQSVQAGSKLAAEDLSKTSRKEMSQRCLQTKEGSPLVSTETEDLERLKTSARPEPAAPEENEKTREGDPSTALLPASEDTGEASTVTAKRHEESAEEPSVSQMKKSPVRRRARLQVTPAITKRTHAKDEGDQPQSALPTSPTRQCTRAAVAKKDFDKTSKKPTKDVPKASQMETNSEAKEAALLASDPRSPKHSAVWPKVVLPRVTVPTSETGVSSGSSTLTSSPLRVSTRISPPLTPQQLKTSPPGVAPKRGSPTSSEDEPSSVSHYFLTDIFTEVEDED